ncbi:MAG TPA: ATP-dependent Clp protease ATP-binding subunit [Candidatus Caccopulliclostridium gallistercoris]|uniref:ATP-dependent Clp protease ATP-binding subunit n=1 Tax=Candidatus Caccopulliclostridium gallistercoris TaxID=2840719 RepID=A0A9D1NDF3_9FIRM|nr:ATP-dependent Clp protease ATP-binding subunit [Candidatus Caccopulliclostridium gallistercoris]
MANLNSFSDSAEKVIKNAGKIARELGSNEVGTEHILYGITSVKECSSAKLLMEYGITEESMETVLEENADSIQIFGTDIEFTPRVKDLFRLAQNIAMQLGHNFIGTEHLLYALLSSSGSFAYRLLFAYFRVNINELKSKVLNLLQGENNANQSSGIDTGSTGMKSTLPEKLLSMGTDITLKAREGKIDPIIGREKEIERVIEILCRKTKNNPVLIGEAGVGKTAVVEGLAQAIVEGNVPELLQDKIIYSLEIGGLMAGTKYRGSMEERLKDIIETIIASKNIIVFIDEIHTLAQAGSEKGETSPADMLKPYLARGELQTIGATTTDEYKKFIEKDKALERRFQPIMVNPPSVEETIEILKGLKDSYEAFHKITITPEAIEAAATLSDRYIMDRSLPDKAIDLIDEASSKAKVNFNLKPSSIREKEEKIKQLSANRDEASIQRNYEKAAKLQSEIIKLENELETLNKEFNKTVKRSSGSIGANEIAEVVSKWTGIPVTKITESEKDRLLHLEEILHKRVVGQDEAVEAVARAIRRSRVGLQDNKRPIGSFLFMGQTGVGKTELSKAIAEAMFDSENNIIRLDMSEYMESHSVAKLIGAPPGYVGYDEGGQLTEQVRRRPYSVVLFDEIEKAHPDIFNALLQILDDGRLTDGQGRLVSFRNTIIIMTSNLGSAEVRAKHLGFNESEEERDIDEIKRIYLDALKHKFKPEFINRIDVICVFHPLSREDLTKIAKILINNINERLKKQNIELKITEEALDLIVAKGCANAEYGARPLKRYIQQEIEDRIAEKMLLGELDKEGNVIIDCEDGKLTFESENNA